MADKSVNPRLRRSMISLPSFDSSLTAFAFVRFSPTTPECSACGTYGKFLSMQTDGGQEGWTRGSWLLRFIKVFLFAFMVEFLGLIASLAIPGIWFMDRGTCT